MVKMEIATSISLGFNLFLALLLVYLDWSRRTDAKIKDEVIKDLSLKLISRTPAEYVQAKGEAVKDTEETPQEYVDVEDVSPETLLEAEDRI
jgi:hypothetical protein